MIVSDRQQICRYMSFGRFLWLLQTKQLWFARFDRLEDKWELKPTRKSLDRMVDEKARKLVRQSKPVDRPALTESIQTQITMWGSRTFVNCWNANKEESHALWRIFCRSNEGVAVRTTVGRLRASLPSDIKLHRVTYCEPGSRDESFKLSGLATEKWPMFRHEQEVRGVFKRLDRETNDAGVSVRCDPEKVLSTVLVHPEADESFFETVKASVAVHAPKLKDRVRWSVMQPPPPF